MSASAPFAVSTRAAEGQVGDLFSRVISELNDGIWKRNLKTSETWVSPRLMQALGFGANEYLPEKDPLGDWVHPDDAESMQTVLRHAARVIGQVTFEVRFRTKQGQYRWFRCRARAWPGSDGRAALVLGALFDCHNDRLALEAVKQNDQLLVDAVREKNRELDAAFKDAQQRQLALERIDAQRTHFLLKVSHGLRTELSNMMGRRSWLSGHRTLPVGIVGWLDVALLAGKSLRDTLDDLVEYAQVDARSAQSADSEFDLGEVVASACRELAPELKTAGTRIDFDYIGQHLMVRGAKRKVGTLLHRVIRYLIQSSPRSVIRLTTRVTTAASEQLAVRFELESAQQAAEQAVSDRTLESTTALLLAQEGAATSHDGLHLPIAERVLGSLGGEMEVFRTSGSGGSVVAALVLARAQHAEEGISQVSGDRIRDAVWVIGYPDAGAHLLAKRLHRLGIDPVVLQSANELVTHEERSGAPRWAILVESLRGVPLPLGEIRRLLPGARIIFSVLDDAPRSDAEAIGATIYRAPFSPRDLCTALLINRTRKAVAAVPKVSSGTRIRRVLLVEDNAVSQLVVAEMLVQLGIQVILASSGEEGLDRYREHAPDAVLMDIGLPGIDGLEAAKRIRAIQLKGLTKKCPIVALTASTADTSRDVWVTAGLDGFLAKPVNGLALDAEFKRLASSA